MPASPENQKSHVIADAGGGMIPAIRAIDKAKYSPDAKDRVCLIGSGHMPRDFDWPSMIVMDTVRLSRKGIQLPLSHGFETRKSNVSCLVNGFPI